MKETICDEKKDGSVVGAQTERRGSAGPARGLLRGKTAPAAWFRFHYQLPAKSSASPSCSQLVDTPCGANCGRLVFRCVELHQSAAKIWEPKASGGLMLPW